jgi:hypothetical protein
MKLFQVLLLFFLCLTLNAHANTLKDINRGSEAEYQVPAYDGDEASAGELNSLQRQEEELIEMEEDGNFEEEIKSENTDFLKNRNDLFHEYVP